MTEQKTQYIAFAPLQGYTDATYRWAHNRFFGGVDEYYTPFVRLERGEMRRKDLRDVDPAACDGVPTVPQVIAADAAEFARLCDALQALGWHRIDLNLGCPFPMQTRAGRGSGLLQHPDRLASIAREMQHRKEVRFSVKMRIGQESVDEGFEALDIVNTMPLLHVVIHPRLGRQQYKGEPNREAFVAFAERSAHPVIYNGDLATAESPVANLKGVMLGRSLLARPWMLCPVDNPADARTRLMQMHACIYEHAERTLCGDSQILSRLHSFWEYLDIDRRSKKAILKASSLPRYREAVALVRL